MRRRLARWQTQWLWLVLLAVLTTQVVPVRGVVALPGVLIPLALAFVRPACSHRDPVEVAAPLQRGRWVALNSPGSGVPSHGVHAYGQTYAIDVLHPSPAGTAAALGWGLRTRSPQQYACFGQPVLAVADGTVVAAVDTQRDHRGRDTWPALLFMLTVEGFVREVGGARWVLGNHLVIDHGDSTFSAYAHLRRRSLRVAPGDRVRAGQQIAVVGNSGNSSEPHLHFQLMDRARPTEAAGLRWRWANAEWVPGDIDPARTTDSSGSDRKRRRRVAHVPANGQIFSIRPVEP